MKDFVSFEEYSKIEVRVGEIVEAIVPQGSNKLIQFRVDFGDFQRVIFSGIKQWYTAEELVGIKTLWIVNLLPKKTPFGESSGMLFATNDKNGTPYIVRIAEEVANGSEFH